MQHTDVILMGTYEWRLVVLSYIVAVVASYTALDLAGRVTASRGRARRVWLLGGAFAMGAGIWSMHFTAMLAFSLPIPVTYDAPIVLLSLVAAMIASGFALFVVSRESLSLERLLVSGLPMGIGIATMHYSGMAALRMPATIEYDQPLFGLSILIAVTASTAALWLAFQLRTERTSPQMWLALKIGSALVMGVAIVGMHYTGMMAAHFMPIPGDATAITGIDALPMGAAIGVTTLVVLGLALISSLVDQRFTEVKRLQEAEASRRAQLELAVGEYLGFAQQVAQGDLTRRIETQYDGALGQLGQGLNGMVASLHDITLQVEEVTGAIAAAVNQILAATTEQAASSAEQSAAITQTATSVEEVKVLAQQTAQKASQITEESQTTLQVAHQGSQAVDSTIAGMTQVRENVRGIAQVMGTMSDHSQAISTMIAMLSELADQIAGLAQNAAIEATSTSAQDRGLSDLARLVRGLSERAKTATGEVREQLSAIQQVTRLAVQGTDQGSRGVEEGAALVSQAGDAIRHLAAEVEHGAQANFQMAAAAQQQLIGMEQIGLAMFSIQQATHQALSGTQQAEKAAQHLHTLAQSLQQAIKTYRL
jgi:NO-binding membrane sensor protein with MHYT domain